MSTHNICFRGEIRKFCLDTPLTRSYDYCLLQNTSDKVDVNVEPQPLWEYPCKAASEPQTLLKIDFMSQLQQIEDIQQKANFVIDG